MTLPAWIAAAVLFLQLPIPLYWFVLHPARKFWSTRRNMAFVVALACSWLPVTVLLSVYHRALLSGHWPTIWRFALGLAMIALEAWGFWRVRHDLGDARLVGAAELSGSGQIAQQGIYSKIRHPRYAGSFIALIGACLLAVTVTLWVITAVWVVLTAITIGMEEKELRIRFGESYNDYCRRVPRFVPRIASGRRP